MRKVYAHLISDSTGDTVSAIARAVFTRFENIDVKYYLWALIGTNTQIDRILNLVKKRGGIIMHTLSNPNLECRLREQSEKNGIVCINAIAELTKKMAMYLQERPVLLPGRRHILDKEYFKRIDAINFTMAHDDGQLPDALHESEIILIGPSRTSKSPTSMYLAYKGFKVANLPFVSGLPFAIDRERLSESFVVGLYTSTDRLIEVRRNRLLSLNARNNAKYVSEEGVSSEIREAKKFYLANDIPIVDITNKSVEETAAKIIQLQQSWKAASSGALEKK